MAGISTPATTELKLRRPGGWGNGGGGDAFGGGNGRMPSVLPQSHMLGMGFALAAIGMLFLGLTSAYVVRQGLGGDWKPISMPSLLPLNTIILVLGSLALERARQWWKSGDPQRAGWWLSFALALGAAFLAGQIAAWRSLAQQGIYLSSSPHSSFFYVLTGVHGLHVAGGLAGLALARFLPPARRKHWLESGALYWHFMGGLWICLLLLLFF